MQEKEILAFMPQSELQEKEILAVVRQSTLQEIKSDLQLIKEEFCKKPEEAFEQSLIESKQVPKLLKISSRTWQSYRDSGEIPFIQLGAKIWVKRKDLDLFLDRYYITNK